MTFLNPLVLAGLAAAAIPILLHLLNLRKLKTVEFSSLRFLREMQRTRLRRIRIRQWLLLALRTLCVAAVVLAFARPAIRGTLPGGTGARARSTIVVLLDDSPSMTVRNERGPLFAQAQAAAESIAALVEEGDVAYLVPFSRASRWEQAPAFGTPEALRTAVRELRPVSPAPGASAALGAAARLTSGAGNLNREVYLVTDAQASQFHPPPGRGLPRGAFPETVRFFVADVGGSAPDNAGIAEARITSRMTSPGRAARLEVTVRSFGRSELVNSVVGVTLGTVRVAQTSADIGPGGSAVVAVPLVPKRGGILQGYAQTEDDALEGDNRRYFVLGVPDRVRVLLAGPDGDRRLAALALSLRPDSGAAAFLTESVSSQELASADLSRFEVLILCGVKSVSPALGSRIAGFVRAGGGLAVFPGNETEEAGFNAGLLAPLGLAPMRLPLAPVARPGTDPSFLGFGAVDYAHPVFEGVFEEPSGRARPPSLESPRIFRAAEIRPGPRGHTVIGLGSGAGFLVEEPVGGGRVFLFAAAAHTAWSDFPLRGLFVPLLHRSVLYLSNQARSPASLTAGDVPELVLRLPRRDPGEYFLFRSPSGVEERAVPRVNPQTGMAAFTPGPALETGVYELRRGSGDNPGTPEETLAAVAVNLDPAESDLRRATAPEMEAFWKAAGIPPQRVVREARPERLPRTVSESRFGVELWKHFVILALLAAVLEMAVAGERRAASMPPEGARAEPWK
ncbi:MAG: BatA domain-containing protein [Bacteroidota bacterium]